MLLFPPFRPSLSLHKLSSPSQPLYSAIGSVVLYRQVQLALMHIIPKKHTTTNKQPVPTLAPYTYSKLTYIQFSPYIANYIHVPHTPDPLGAGYFYTTVHNGEGRANEIKEKEH